MRSRKARNLLSAFLGLLCLSLAGIGAYLGVQISQVKRYEEQISLGDKYLEELDYENAEISYRKAVEISEKRESSYVKLTVLYMEQEEYEKAAQVIEEGREQTGKEEVFSDLQQKVEELESSREPEEETSQKEEEKESFDWESAFEKTVLSELELLTSEDLNHASSSGEQHPQNGVISADTVEFKGETYFYCISLISEEGISGLENHFHLTLYRGEDLVQVGDVTMGTLSYFGGGALNEQKAAVMLREEENSLQWIFGADTWFWGSMWQETEVLSFDGKELKRELRLTFHEGGNESVVKRNEEEVYAYYDGQLQTGTAASGAEAYAQELERENLPENLEAFGQEKEICRLEYTALQADGTGSGSYTGTVTDHTGLAGRLEGKNEPEQNTEESGDYEMPQEHWEMLSQTTGQMISMLDYKGMLSEGTEVGIAELPQEYIGELAVTCLNKWWKKEEFPSLGIEGVQAYYEEAVIQNFYRTVTGKDLEGILKTGREMDLTYENGKYGIFLADGAPNYTVRYLEGTRQGDTVTALMELLETGNTVRTSAGCYQVKYGIDPGSVFGHHLISVEKLPDPDGAFSEISASSTLAEAGQDHSPAVLRDHDMTTAWSEGVGGTGVGETIRLSAQGVQKVHGIRLGLGFLKDQGLLERNGRPAALHFAFSDGTELDAVFEPDLYGVEMKEGVQASYHVTPLAAGYGADRWELAQGYLDYVSFGQEIETEWIEITITDARAGTKYEDTCISELVVY